MSRRLDLDWSELDIAFEGGGPGGEAYLDRESGAVVWVTEDLRREVEEGVEPEASAFGPEELAQARAAVEDPNRYLVIPEEESREGYRDMEAFIDALGDCELARLLAVAIRGRGAFRRFKDVLAAHPAERERWFAFRDGRLRARILDWLEAEGIKPARPPGPEG
jgi:hypothetical protein